MKLTIVLSTTHAETNWNTLRLANLAINKGDHVSIFLSGEGVEYAKNSSDRFNIKGEIQKFLKPTNAKIIACSTCMGLRNQKGSLEYPQGGLKDLYRLIADNDKVITF